LSREPPKTTRRRWFAGSETPIATSPGTSDGHPRILEGRQASPTAGHLTHPSTGAFYSVTSERRKAIEISGIFFSGDPLPVPYQFAICIFQFSIFNLLPLRQRKRLQIEN
jgi:hypothetical protein